MFNNINNRAKKALAVSLSLVSVMSSMTSLAIKPLAIWEQDANGNWHYFDQAGNPLINWQLIDGNWYYFDHDGRRVADWQRIDGNWYYFYEDTAENRAAGIVGQLARNMWELGHNGAWYYVDANGIEVTDWQQINGEWYYFYENTAENRVAGRVGQLARNIWELGHDGNWYYAGANGQMVRNQWQQDPDGTLHYLGADGRMVTGWQDINGGRYYFDQAGIMVANAWENQRYLGADGRMVTGWQDINHDRYYFDQTGMMVRNQRMQHPNGNWYNLGPDGIAR